MTRRYVSGWAVWLPFSNRWVGIYALALEAYAHDVAAQHPTAQVVPMWRGCR